MAAPGLLSQEDVESVDSRVRFVDRALSVNPVCFCALVQALTSCIDLDALHDFKLRVESEVLLRLGLHLHLVVFGDGLLTPTQRLAVLVHLKAVVALDDSGSSSKRRRRRWVVSDIDDTLFPTFKDFRGYSAALPYPGAVRFLHQLASSPARLSFITARPPFLMSTTKRDLARVGFANNVVLMGTSTSAVSGNLLAQKLKQAREMTQLWPECDFVLVGDNGQRDIDLGRALLDERLVTHVFIHDIYLHAESHAPPRVSAEGRLQRSSSRNGYRQQECTALGGGEAEGGGMWMFSSYATAALLAKQAGLFTCEEMDQVARSCAEEFAKSCGDASELRQHVLRDFGQILVELEADEEAQHDFWAFVHHTL